MPMIEIKMLKGRATTSIDDMIRRITAVVSDVLQEEEDHIQVTVTEFEPTHWGKGGESFKKQGHS